MNEYYFVNARNALKMGLEILDVKKGDQILVPDYICESIITPINSLNIEVKYYSLNDKFLPDWIQLKNLLSPKVKAILMVNYFGNVLEVEKYIMFAKKNNIYLIEDNAHGYGGIYKGKKLGSFGDIAISSPRKMISLNYGGILHLNNNKFIKIKVNDKNMQNYLNNSNRNNYLDIIKKLIPNNLKRILRKMINKRPIYEDQNSFRKEEKFPQNISKKDVLKIKNYNWEINRSLRNKKYRQFEIFCKKNNLKLLFDHFEDTLSPWCCAAYVKNHKEAIKYFDYGWKKNIKIFSWPTLPTNLCYNNSKPLERWKTLIFFSTD